MKSLFKFKNIFIFILILISCLSQHVRSLCKSVNSICFGCFDYIIGKYYIHSAKTYKNSSVVIGKYKGLD